MFYSKEKTPHIVGFLYYFFLINSGEFTQMIKSKNKWEVFTLLKRKGYQYKPDLIAFNLMVGVEGVFINLEIIS